MGLVAPGFGDDGAAEQPEQFGDADGDEFEGAGVAVELALEGRGDGEERGGGQAEGGPPVPGGPGGDLPGVQSGDLLGYLVILLDFPARDGHPDQGGQRGGLRGPAEVVADGPGVAVPAQEQDGVPGVVSVGGVVGDDFHHGPVVVLCALGGLAGAGPLPH